MGSWATQRSLATAATAAAAAIFVAYVLERSQIVDVAGSFALLASPRFVGALLLSVILLVIAAEFLDLALSRYASAASRSKHPPLSAEELDAKRKRVWEEAQSKLQLVAGSSPAGSRGAPTSEGTANLSSDVQHQAPGQQHEVRAQVAAAVAAEHRSMKQRNIGVDEEGGHRKHHAAAVAVETRLAKEHEAAAAAAGGLGCNEQCVVASAETDRIGKHNGAAVAQGDRRVKQGNTAVAGGDRDMAAAGASSSNSSSGRVHQSEWIQQLQAESQAAAEQRQAQLAAERAARAKQLLDLLKMQGQKVEAEEAESRAAQELAHSQREAENAQIMEDRMLREEQDAQYHESLRRDAEKLEERRRQQEEAQREEEEAAEKLRREEEKVERLQELKRQLTEGLEEEPGSDVEDTVTIRVRIPECSRPFTRQFLASALVQSVYNWVQQLEEMPMWEPGTWKLMSTYPREEVGRDGQVGEAMGGCRQVALMVEAHG